MKETTMTDADDKNGAALDPNEELPAPEPELDTADIAAAAVTALEVLIEMLPENLADEVVERFERRSAFFRTAQAD